MQAPEFSAELYRNVTDFAQGTPGWVHTAAEVGTDAGLVLFAALMAAGWWRARPRTSRSMALILLAPVVTVAAYLLSEVSKTLLDQERPCRAVAGAVPIAVCPAPGDWSFPSNHATIAAASAVALTLAWRAVAPLVLPLMLLMAFSRVFVGVHYPHDVAAGVAVGAGTAALLGLLAAPAATGVVRALRGRPAVAWLVASRPGRHSGGRRGRSRFPDGDRRPRVGA
jgi:membrane-associated phospholipid phosphatase